MDKVKRCFIPSSDVLNIQQHLNRIVDLLRCSLFKTLVRPSCVGCTVLPLSYRLAQVTRFARALPNFQQEKQPSGVDLIKQRTLQRILRVRDWPLCADIEKHINSSSAGSTGLVFCGERWPIE